MVIGDDRKYLSALIALKVGVDKDGKPNQELSEECKIHLKNFVKGGESIKTVQDAMKSPELHKYIQDCIDLTNSKAISRAQNVRKW